MTARLYPMTSWPKEREKFLSKGQDHTAGSTPLTSAWAWNSWSFVCLHAAGRGDGDRDGQAAVVAGAGRGGAAVDRRDGGNDRQAESGAVMGGAVVEPLKRLE